MAVTGSIPDTLKVVLRDEATHDGTIKGARAAFIVNGDKDTDVAVEWAKGRYPHRYGPGATDMPEVIEVPNDPFPFVTLIGCVERGNGGRAWKAVTPQGWLVDLREDVFLEGLFTNRIQSMPEDHGFHRGVFLEGPLQWVQNGSAMRIVLVGSTLHKELAALDTAKKLPKPEKFKAKDLRVGGVYINPNIPGYGGPMKHVFVGFVRVNGKKSMAWWSIDLKHPNNTHEENQAYCRELQKRIDVAFERGLGSDYLTITGSCSYTDIVANVKVPVGFHTKFRYCNGYGERLNAEYLEWV